MIHEQNAKHTALIKPASVATNATATGMVDTLGMKHVAISVILDSQTSTTSKPATLKITEDNTTVISSASAITALTGGTATGNFTIPAAQTAANIVKLDIDCRKRKRYLFLSFTPGDAAQIIAAESRGTRLETAPTDATGLGVAAHVIA